MEGRYIVFDANEAAGSHCFSGTDYITMEGNYCFDRRDVKVRLTRGEAVAGEILTALQLLLLRPFETTDADDH